MLAERENFFRRLESIKSACDESLLVSIADPMHDERAKQLRCGLCVMTFSALEDFMRNVAARALGSLSPATIPFSRLPVALQKSATLDALYSLAAQSKHFDKGTQVALLAAEFKTLSSVGDAHFQISKYAFLRSGSNVCGDEIFDVLTSVGVDKPWEAMHHTGQRLGIALVNPPKSSFPALALDRHAAAHDQTFDIPTTKLKDSISVALSIGICFDIVLSSAIGNLNTSIAKNGGKVVDLVSSKIDLRFVCNAPKRGKYSVRSTPTGRALKADANMDTIRAVGLASLKVPGALLVHDAAGRPVAWY